MPTINGDIVPFCGMLDTYAEGSPTAWGARLIVNQNGFVDFVHDRQGAAGDGRAEFLDQLNEEFPLPALRQAIKSLLLSGDMDTRERKHFIIHTSDLIQVHADTHGSGGYCYVLAVARTPDSDKVAADLRDHPNLETEERT